ncbi:MAG: CehA/McbA family metallohydrolase [candidate division KSB1 bacterium]|nr:CehA/McbA family metallohydrolase [candidate division KSB1 bacterium]MDZ7274435.1 CehA/McbA family metallohydrolase [candidate division KSB1 bacterium]MDZ7284903.1 CehA/McbA family metallohydrolase [candidate division KSB1 bacterium]MDZ7297676.1 CehA/McbA family metallohydrolase [candidate division KSB1 bacterium]MDZ7305900.1 CehA/McbA family metallohydrolase [candidate division KSB1 bacterium]
MPHLPGFCGFVAAVVFDCDGMILPAALLFLLYAEIHYRFKFTPSRLYRRQPEIVADVPQRLEPHTPLPVLLLVKDAGRFPCELQSLTVTLQFATPAAKCNQPLTHKLTLNEIITAPLWWRVVPVPLPAAAQGPALVTITIDYRLAGRQLRCVNDNYVGTSHAPFHLLLAGEPLPALPGYCQGDLHCHSDATSDQVEFGAPLGACAALGKAMGLSFCAVTDHSYDLDDFPDDYLHNDPALRKWHALRAEIAAHNAGASGFVIIPGEEVSCGNAQGRNVHFLIFNHSRFIRGSGDSAERWLRTRPEHTITEVLAQLEPDALAFAAHPAVPPPVLEKWLLGRGHWQHADLAHPRLNGLQFWNGGKKWEEEGLQQWRALLLAGRRIYTIAGSDAHGNFNRFRQIAFPFVKMVEHHRHLFGSVRTAALLEGRLGLDSLLAALRLGRACLTTGPLLDLRVIAATGRQARLGDYIPLASGRLQIAAVSTAEFGSLAQVRIWRGDPAQHREEIIHEVQPAARTFTYQAEVPLPHTGRDFYLRAEALSERTPLLPGQSTFCRALTNPIWVTPAHAET